MRWVMAMCAAFMALVPGAARAENPRVNLETFRPSGSLRDLGSTRTNEIGRWLDFSAGLLFHYGAGAFSVADAVDGTRQEVVSDQLFMEIGGMFSTRGATSALLEDSELSFQIAIPVALVQSGENGFTPITAPSGAAFGDMRLEAKWILAGREAGNSGFGFGTDLVVSLPTGSRDDLTTDGFQVSPALLADWSFGPLVVAVNLGGHLRESAKVLPDVPAGTSFFWRVAASFGNLLNSHHAGPSLQGMVDLEGNAADWGDPNTQQIEARLGGRVGFAADWFGPAGRLVVTAGVGFGLSSGWGQPTWRGILGVAWSPETRVVEIPVVVDPDPDRDGIKGAADKCPTVPEVYDNVRDEDGCPDDMGSDPSKDPATDPTKEPGVDPTKDPGTLPAPQETTPAPCPPSGPRPEGCAEMGRARWTGQAIVLEPPIRFETDTATIRVESADTVRALAALLGTELSGKRVRIEGHFKAALDATSKLPELRANAVLDALVAAGVRADRLEAIGLRYDLDAGGKVAAGIVVKVLGTK